MTAGLVGALSFAGSIAPAAAGPAPTGLVAAASTFRRGPTPSVEALVPMFHVARDVQPSFEDLLTASPTFREQVRRIVRAGVRVVIDVRSPEEFDRDVEALTTLVRDESRHLRFARVRLSYGAPWPRVLPHELEHILEQIDGVNLAQLAAKRDGHAWRIGVAYETRRAQLAGVLVSREYYRRTPITRMAAQ